MSQGEEKTEQPSEFKLREARKKGQVAKSSDVVVLTSFTLVALFIAFFSSFCIKKITIFLNQILHQAQSSDIALVYEALGEALDLWLLVSLPILVVASLASIGASVMQFGFLFTTHPLKGDLKRIDPIAGFKKLFSKNRGLELIKQLLKFSLILTIIYLTIADSIKNIIMLFRISLFFSIEVIVSLISTIIIRVIICFIAIAIFDYFWQRHSFIKSMRMSKYEVKKEYKQQEGDPHIKQERRRIQHEALESLSVSEVKDASVVITNPSHIAVALHYDEKQDGVPKVVAKGMGKIAKIIIEEAKNNSVPIMRNVPLARDLQWLEINEEIPKNLYDSVAEVLTFINELNESTGSHHEN